VDVGALVAFTLLHASVIGYFVTARKAEPRLAHRLVPLVGAGVTVWVIAEASPLAQGVGALWAIAGLGVYLAQKRS
jgi:hypothetical protein